MLKLLFLRSGITLGLSTLNESAWRAGDKSSAGVALSGDGEESISMHSNVNMRKPVARRWRSIQARGPPWLWNTGQASPEVQNRGISGPCPSKIYSHKDLSSECQCLHVRTLSDRVSHLSDFKKSHRILQLLHVRIHCHRNFKYVRHCPESFLRHTVTDDTASTVA